MALSSFKIPKKAKIESPLEARVPEKYEVGDEERLNPTGYDREVAAMKNQKRKDKAKLKRVTARQQVDKSDYHVTRSRVLRGERRLEVLRARKDNKLAFETLVEAKRKFDIERLEMFTTAYEPKETELQREWSMIGKTWLAERLDVQQELFLKQRGLYATLDQRPTHSSLASVSKVNEAKSLEQDAKEVKLSGAELEGILDSLDRLEPGQMINDIVINGYFAILRKRYPEVLLLPSYLWTKVTCSFRVESVPAFFYDAKKEMVDLRDYKVLMLPVFIPAVGVSHWVLLSLDFRSGLAMVFDSGTTMRAALRARIEKLWKKLDEVFVGTKNYLLFRRKPDIQFMECTRQTTDYDCGIFVMAFANQLCEGKPAVCHDPNAFRQVIKNDFEVAKD